MVSKDTLIQRRVLRSTISNYVGQFLTLGALFLLMPFILRHLGPTVYGLWILVNSVVGYGSLLDFGIWGAIIKYIAEYRARGEAEQARHLLGTTIWLYCFLALIAIGFSVAIAPLFPRLFNVPADQHVTAIWLVILLGLRMGIAIPCMTPMAVLRGLQRYDLVNLIDILGTLFTVVGTIGVLSMGGGLFGMVGINICSLVVMLVPSLWFIGRIAPELRGGWREADRQLLRLVISYSWPLFVKDIASRLQTRTDEITIGAFLPISFITPYSVVRRLSEATHILTKQFMKVFLPLASELDAENDRGRLRTLYITGTRLTLVIFLPIAAALTILAHSILTLWVGAEYASSAHLVALLTLASLFVTIQWPAVAVLQGMARHRLLAATSLGSGLANLVLSIALIHPLGLVGVALGTLIPAALECVGFVLPYTMRVIGVTTDEALKRIFLPALLPVLPMVLVLYSLQRAVELPSVFSLILITGVGLLVYGAGYLSVGASAAERRIYRNILFDLLLHARALRNRS
jgi:O-antigen/teichoic acid export membrane protein